MAISAVLPNISFGRRGVDSRTAFVEKQHAGQDLLSTTWTTQLNLFGQQATALEANVNAKEISAAISATTATNKAIIATEKANQILGYVIPPTATYSPTDIDAKDAVYRSTEFAISGAINKASRTGAYSFQETAPNYLHLWGAKKYYFKSLDKIVTLGGDIGINFPTAPTATNLISNGTFDTDTSGYTATAGAILSIDTQRLKVDVTANLYGSGTKTLATVIGKKYIVEANFTAGTGMGGLTVGVSAAGGQLGYVNNSASYKRVEFTATTTTTYIDLQGNGTSGYFFVDNLAAFESEQLLCYDNLLLKDDGNYIITRTEQNQYITMDTMLNYTSKVYNSANGADTGTSITMTYDMVNEEYSGSDGHKYLTIGATARLPQ